MYKIIAFLFAFRAITTFAQQSNDDFFSNSQVLFSKFTNDGKVDYKAVKSDSLLMNTLVEQIKSFNIRLAGSRTRKAFYLNTYNILVIKTVADAYPIKSALDIDGFFDLKEYDVAGEKLSLDEIEKIKLLNEFDDLRMHFWLVPAAVGSPPINENAMMLYNMDELLDQQVKVTLNNDEFIGTDAGHKDLFLPVMFKLYENEFNRDGKTFHDFINLYRRKKVSKEYKINYYIFNRDLNDVKQKSGRNQIIENKYVPAIPVKYEHTDTLSTAASIKIKTDSAKIKSVEKLPEIKTDSAKIKTIEPLPEIKTILELPPGDDILSEGANILSSGFQVRISTNLVTQHASYNSDLNRQNNDFRSSNFNLTVQCWDKVTNRIDIGVQFAMRSLNIAGFNSSPYEALSFSNDTNSKFYFRHVTNSVKYLFYDKRTRLVGQSSFLIPVSKANEVNFDNKSLRDPVQAQWINQLYYVNVCSKYFTLFGELNGNYRLNVAETSNRFIVRASLMPEFTYWVGRSFRFYAFCEFNPQLTQGLFSNFYFREGGGITLLSEKVFQLDFQYYYYAFGKKTNASHSFTAATRFNF